MKGINLIRKHWHIILFLITSIFVVGQCYNKIEVLSEKSLENDKNIQQLEKSMYVLTGIIQAQNPKINILAYINAIKNLHLSQEKISTDFQQIQNLPSDKGEIYLMDNFKMSREQVKEIYSR